MLLLKKKGGEGKIECFSLKLSFAEVSLCYVLPWDFLLFSHHQSIILRSESAHPLIFSSLQFPNEVSNSKLLSC